MLEKVIINKIPEKIVVEIFSEKEKQRNDIAI